MIPSLQANRSQWSGRGFEIWFFVVLVPGIERALWVRFTRFASDRSSDARVWAVVSERGATTAAREIHPLTAMSTHDDAGEFRVRVGDAEFGHGRSKGSCAGSGAPIRWELGYDATDPLVERVPKLPGFVPLGTHATHPHADAAVTGWVELDGQRLDLDGGLLTQMHIWGKQRLEWLRWVWAPRFTAGDASLELTAVAPKAGGANLCSLWAKLGDEVVDNTSLTKSARASVASIRAGVLHHATTYSGGRMLVRGWAPPATYAGWDYRKLEGGDLHVAQTNLAQVEVELYERAGLGALPKQRLRSSCAAIEFHGPEDYEEFSYVGWDEPKAAIRARRATDASLQSDPRAELRAEPRAEPPGAGAWIDTPAPTGIIALGLTYKAHAKETASGPDPVVFDKDPAVWSPGAGELLRPSSSRLRAVLEALDPTLSKAMSSFGFVPAMLDYEVELGLILLDGLADPGKLDTLASGGRVALVVANDVTARSVQILGEGQPNRLAYWRAAKSLPGFAPTSARAWVPAQFNLDAWPALRLETLVNGEVRQDAGLELLLETPRQMLTRVCEARGAIPPGTLLLTGTPSGVAFTVPRWKRVMGERLLDRLGKLRAAIRSFATSTMFLRPGDVVEVRAGYLGSIERVVGVEPDD
ncbi:Fumarylacetoacetate hydrolase family protein [Enhygromyxa salina]|uniref:Fumarylacetoacetate hydrolase family protein n=1 Tax=Enhygromyxa salina TaxID=215803 RepID=A0A0C2D4Q6_9BACT|nr:fumarylacetoacetate hydrolase family protein [Enhygromyxa salina]KIG15062.1 Fumarylacetoacetate hydrolase family protein [Enhygromyxa salina]